MAFALRRVRHCALPASFALSVLAVSISAAFADDATDLGNVGAQAAQTSSNAPTSPAETAAPSSASLQASEPQSKITRTFIENAKPANSDYSAIVAIAPSVSGGVTANGPGLGETKNAIRGFQDGQYNITWDGIPFGDTNGPTHHSTSYFPASVIGSVDIERGPGMASNMGQATFGGSVNMFSRDISNTEVLSPYFSVGSWNTKLKGVRFDTGTVEELGGAKASINYQQMSSDGALTFNKVDEQNLAVKLQKALGDSTVMTVFVNHDSTVFNSPDGSNGLTMAQAQTYGKNYSLSGDASKANYFGYNRQMKSTDMDYLRLQSELGSNWSTDNMLYYYNYDNNTIAAASPAPGTGVTTFSPTPTTTAPGIPGYQKINKYWVSGDIFKATKQLDSGLLRVGAWLEHAETFRGRFDENVQSGAQNYVENPVPGLFSTKNPIKYDQDSSWNNYQPFAEFEWKASDHLTVTPGFKYVNTFLRVDAEVNQTARITQDVDKRFTASLPYLTANYRFNDAWSTYAQYAQGMVVPDISSYQSTNAQQTDIQPQKTTNYQLGMVHKDERLVFDADVYYINFTNMIAQVPGSSSSQPFFYNAGGSTYKGIEAEASYVLVDGLSVFANGSANHAVSKATNLEIANAPTSTRALGSIYQAHHWNFAYVYKHVGDLYALPNAGYKMSGYNTTDVTVAYTFNPSSKVRNVKLQFGVYNLQNRQSAIAVTTANTTGIPNAQDTFFFQPTRSYMGTLSLDI